ncbi:MAG: DUF4105 domain-containing protein [Planctomycetota bacterium]
MTVEQPPAASAHPPGRPGRMARFLPRAGRGGLWTAAVAGWLWGLGALWWFAAWPPIARHFAAGTWLCLLGAVFVLVHRRYKPYTLIASAAVVALLWSFQQPALDRDWSPDQVMLPKAAQSGSRITIRNIRHTVYRTETDLDVAWYDRSFDLDTLVSADFMVETFDAWRGPAHTLISFGFADGDHIAISVEIRRERGEEFSALRGLFRNYEIMYVIGDERDLIGLRANIRRNPVYLYPVKAAPERIRALFTAMLKRATRLAAAPKFYNTLTNTCTTNITGHLRELGRTGFFPDHRVLLPGYADELALELGLIDVSGTIAEARARYRINDRSAFGADGREWSRQIRGLPPATPRSGNQP